MNMPGDVTPLYTVTVFDWAPLLTTWMLRKLPSFGAVYGTTAETCVALTKYAGAGVLLIRTWTPPSVFGKGAEAVTGVAGPRPVPNIVMISPGATCAVTGTKLAPLTTPCGFRTPVVPA